MATSSFNSAIKHILEREGGFVDNENDPGGATNFGVSLRFLKKQLEIMGGPEIFDFDGDGDLDADDIKAMSEQEAKDIYFKFWWEKYNYRQISDQDLAIKVFDMSVNMGGRQAHKLIQRACRAAGGLLDDDGILGSKSFSVINSVNAMVVLGAVRTEQKHFYLQLIKKNSSFSVFKNGWLKRAYM